MEGARHEQAVAMLTSLERYMRLVCEREIVVPKGGPRPTPSPVLKPSYTNPYQSKHEPVSAPASNPAAAPTAPRPLPRKLTSSSSITSETESPQVRHCPVDIVALCLMCF